MKHRLKQYAIGSVSNRQRPTDQEIVLDYDATDYFSTYVIYDDSALQYFDEKGRIGGFKSDVTTDIVPFDIDSKNLDEKGNY